MAVRQVKYPKLAVPAVRGWCLKYVDDAGGAPNTAPPRQKSAQAAYDVEKRNGNIRDSALPVGVWVPIFFSLDAGPYKGLGHVAWANNRGSYVEIYDSETAAGARAAYRSIDEVLRWFGNHGIKYRGWSLWVDGVQAAEEYTPPAVANGKRIDRKGTATVLVQALNVRNEPTRNSAVVATYSKGQKFNYDSYIISDGHLWLSYVSNSGVRRYAAEGVYDGNRSNVWVSGGIS